MAEVAKTLIVTTGDCSDYDGFTALPLYQAAVHKAGGGTVLFIMNYPGFFSFKASAPSVETIGDANSFKRVDAPQTTGTCGYTYTADEFYKFRAGKTKKDGTFEFVGADHTVPLLPSFGSMPTPQGFNGTSEHQMRLLTQYAAVLATNIWQKNRATFPNAELKFVVGGINTYNGFSIDVYKNELDVYKSVVSKQMAVIPSTMLAVQGDAMAWLSQYHVAYKRIFMDMNGSMAWWNGGSTVPTWIGKLEGLYIMGGMPYPIATRPDLIPPDNTPLPIDTITNTRDDFVPHKFMSRKVYATFNQLYAPVQTDAFLRLCDPTKVFAITNNTCNAAASYGELFKRVGRPTQYNSPSEYCVGELASKGILGPSDVEAYTQFLKVPGAAPIVFDLVCAAKLASDVNRPVGSNDSVCVIKPSNLVYEVRDGIMEYFVVTPDDVPQIPSVGGSGSKSRQRKIRGGGAGRNTISGIVDCVYSHDTLMQAIDAIMMTKTLGGGGRRRKGGRVGKKPVKKKTKWTSVKGKKATLKDGSKRAIYTSPSHPGEVRIRRMVWRKGADKASATYLKWKGDVVRA